jgi:hypothetical protein
MQGSKQGAGRRRTVACAPAGAPRAGSGGGAAAAVRSPRCLRGRGGRSLGGALANLVCGAGGKRSECMWLRMCGTAYEQSGRMRGGSQRAEAQ